jgi:hypothetical protein
MTVLAWKSAKEECASCAWQCREIGFLRPSFAEDEVRLFVRIEGECAASNNMHLQVEKSHLAREKCLFPHLALEQLGNGCIVRAAAEEEVRWCVCDRVQYASNANMCLQFGNDCFVRNDGDSLARVDYEVLRNFYLCLPTFAWCV